MKHSQKARYIVLGCMFAVGVVSAIVIWKTYRPSPGKPFEQITLEQAREFMTYETGYILVDIGTPGEYEEGHLDGAANLPYDQLAGLAMSVLPDQSQQIYLYGRETKKTEMAAHKLCELGYTNISEIIDAADDGVFS